MLKKTVTTVCKVCHFNNFVYIQTVVINHFFSEKPFAFISSVSIFQFSLKTKTKFKLSVVIKNILEGS